jgi:hypothetical protein
MNELVADNSTSRNAGDENGRILYIHAVLDDDWGLRPLERLKSDGKVNQLKSRILELTSI